MECFEMGSPIVNYNYSEVVGEPELVQEMQTVKDINIKPINNKLKIVLPRTQQ